MQSRNVRHKPAGAGMRYVVQRIVLALLFGVILFAAAGSVRWTRAWIYLIYGLLVEMGSLIILAVRAPETLNQRGVSHAGVKPFDRAFAASWLALALISPMIAGLDKRFGWSTMSEAALYAGAGVLAAGYVLGTWAMVENEHFEQFVRIQTERAHRVVATGPYRIVRHPGYAGSILGMLGVPLMLGTWWAFVPLGAVVVLFVVRTALEDRTLRQELEGYEAYAQRTRYRLLPGIW